MSNVFYRNQLVVASIKHEKVVILTLKQYTFKLRNPHWARVRARTRSMLRVRHWNLKPSRFGTILTDRYRLAWDWSGTNSFTKQPHSAGQIDTVWQVLHYSARYIANRGRIDPRLDVDYHTHAAPVQGPRMGGHSAHSGV